MVEIETCFHCGLPCSDTLYYVKLDSLDRAMCCLGCKAVAEAIIENNLQSYYQLRDETAISQHDRVPPDLLALEQYDLDDIQDAFIEKNGIDSQKSILLSIEGISCAACVWLLESRLKPVPGVVQFEVNLTTQRAKLTWCDETVNLASILRYIADIGFRAYPYQREHQEQLREQAQRAALKRLAVSGFGLGQVMMFSAPLYGWFSQEITPHYRDFFRVVSLLVTTPVLLYCGLPFFKAALRSLASRRLSMDVALSLALIVVFCAGLSVIILQTGTVYFDTITMLLFFITLGRYIELRARHQSCFISQTLTQSPQTWVMREGEQGCDAVPLGKLKEGDNIRVKAGETIPADGLVVNGITSVSESLLTGESMPKTKQEGDSVLAGSHNVDHPITVRVTHCGEDTAISAIVRLFERAQFDKPKLVLFTQQFAHYFVLFQILAAIALFSYYWPVSITQAYGSAVALLLVCCPCALALATPIALSCTMKVLSKLGFLCTRGHVIETLPYVTDIIFDKTGTLTEGVFTLKHCEVFSSLSQDKVLAIAAALESHSEHPLASAFRSMTVVSQPQHVKVHPNLGVEGHVCGEQYFIGNSRFIETNTNASVINTQNQDNSTVIYLADKQQCHACFYLQDSVRFGTKATIDALQQQGYRLHILSGDNTKAVTACAESLTIDHATANCSVEDKLQYIKHCQKRGSIVIMVGDGLNDAPLLMQADVAIAMSNAADLTRVNADAVLMTEALTPLPLVLNQSRKAKRIITQCLFWAVAYNLTALPLAMTGHVAPYVAAGLMSLSSVLVVLNALRLLAPPKRFDKIMAHSTVSGVACKSSIS